MRHRPLSVFLDAVRFVAAFAVVVGHARLSALGQTKPAMDRFDWLIYQFGNYSHVAVTVFFVISGYLVGGKLFDAGKPGFLPRYLLDRSTRIYVVAAPVLILAFASVGIQHLLLGYALQLGPGICRPEPVDLLGTLALLHYGFGFSICPDGPVWSLVYEVFYYLFFAMVALAWFRWRERAGKLAALAAVALALYAALEPTWMMWALSTIWLLGMAVAQPAPLRGRGLVLTGAALALFALQNLLRTDDDVRQEVVATLGVIAAILAIRRFPDRPVPAWFAGFAATGAAFSYSLYLAHAPVMNLAKTVANARFGAGIPINDVSPASVLAWTLFVLAGFAAGGLSYWCFERHTGAVRRWLGTRLGILKPSSEVPPEPSASAALETSLGAGEAEAAAARASEPRPDDASFHLSRG